MDTTEKQKLVKDIKAISQEAEDVIIVSLDESVDFRTANNLENYLRQQLPKRTILVFTGNIEVKEVSKAEKLRIIGRLIS